MRGKPVTRCGIIFLAAFASVSAYAQQQEATQQPQDFSTAFSNANAACMALWADHAFDPLRDKFPFGGEKPTFGMLTDRTRVLPKDRPLAELAIKTLGKCKALYADAIAKLPQQTQKRLEGYYREQDSLNARLYLGKITIGEYNVGINRIATEEMKAFFGDVRPDSDGASKQALAVQPGAQTATIQQPHQTRLALVIGNSNYTDLPKLKNPANDARAIVGALRDVGFDVTSITDASEINIRRAVRKFADQSGRADIALVYYAGHGAQVNGGNYLLPVDMEIPHTEADIELSSMKVDDLINSIRSTTKIVFLDACRDNPALFKNMVKGRGAVATGLAPTDASHLAAMKPGEGVFIAYATDAGSIALEGEGDHSPFTQALLKNLKKPISLDDMFSFVTKEVSLVTKGMQRPYKYASLVDPVCLTGGCSSAAPGYPTDIVQEARRSEAGELQIALQTNNRDALETYLEKYPESQDRQKVLAEISRLTRSEFNEWSLFELSNLRFPQYLKLSSIRQFGDRVAFQQRGLGDPSFPIGLSKYPEGTYAEATVVVDCKQSIMAIADTRAVDPSGQILGKPYKWAEPEFVNLSMGQAIQPGTVAQTAKNIVCNDKLRNPLVNKKQLATMNFSDLATLPDGDGEIYYQVIQDDDVPKAQRDAIVLFMHNNDKELITPPGVTLKLGTYKTGVFWDRFQCQERKFSALKSEFYDASNELKHLMAADLSKEPVWSEIKETSPLDTLQQILCGPQTYAGLGVRLAQNGGATTVAEVFGGSPAEKAGVKANDTIAAIDNEPVSGLTLQQITEKARGPSDTKVVLTILREGQTSPMELTVTRQNIQIQPTRLAPAK